MLRMDWKQAIKHWRALNPEQQRQIRRQRLPRMVAHSMTFEGEPVDQAMLEEALVHRTQRPVTSTPRSAS